MEALLSAVAGDLVGRLVSFLISKFQEPGSTDDISRLQRALLRARVVVEEAEARQVTNRAMLLQLHQLKGEMCRGAYVLDALVRRTVEPSRRRTQSTASHRSLGLPPDVGGLSAVAESMEAALSDLKEFVVLLGGCPRVAKPPYSAYLFMETYMFGRQMEKEHLIGFLLQPSPELDVLPIIGPHEVGKRTLVEHVCLDERVRERFAKIHRLCGDKILEELDVLQGLTHDAVQRSLIVIDFASGDKDEKRWRRFYSTVRRRVHRDSKIIIISRTEAHTGLGTAPPLRLRELRHEELWYFFKAMAFGGADPDERPVLVRIAMAAFVRILDLASFAAVNKIAASLRADLSARSWRRVLQVSTGLTEVQLGALPDGVRGRSAEEKTGCLLPRVPVKGRANCPCLFYGRRKSTTMSRSELPTVTMLELIQGVVSAGEKPFDVLVWQSRIPPYASYVATCDMERAAKVEIGSKRWLLHKRRRDQLDCGSGEVNEGAAASIAPQSAAAGSDGV